MPAKSCRCQCWPLAVRSRWAKVCSANSSRLPKTCKGEFSQTQGTGSHRNSRRNSHAACSSSSVSRSDHHLVHHIMNNVHTLRTDLVKALCISLYMLVVL